MKIPAQHQGASGGGWKGQLHGAGLTPVLTAGAVLGLAGRKDGGGFSSGSFFGN